MHTRKAQKRQFPVKLFPDTVPGVRVKAIPLVDRNHQRPPLLGNIPGQCRILFADAFTGIQHQHHDIRCCNRLQCLDDTELLDRLADTGLATHTGRIDQGIGAAVALERDEDAVAGGARQVVCQHPLLAEDPVDQRGLADIRPANDGDPDRVIRLAGVVCGRCFRQRHISQRRSQQFFDTAAVCRRDRPGLAHTQAVKLRCCGIDIDAVCLVDHQINRLAAAAQCRGNRLVDATEAFPAINQEKDPVSLFHGLPGLLRHEGIEVFPFAGKPPRVDNDKRAVAEAAVAVFTVPRQSGNIGDQRITGPCQPVEQGGLANIGASYECDHGDHR